MKNKLKRFICIIMLLVCFAGLAAVPAAAASTSIGTYDASKAVAYGRAQWYKIGDKRLCASFVAGCIEAGGLDLKQCKNKGNVGSLRAFLTQYYESSTQVDWNKLRPGDLAFTNSNAHVVLVTGVDAKNKTISYVARNKVHGDANSKLSQAESEKLIMTWNQQNSGNKVDSVKALYSSLGTKYITSVIYLSKPLHECVSDQNGKCQVCKKSIDFDKTLVKAGYGYVYKYSPSQISKFGKVKNPITIYSGPFPGAKKQSVADNDFQFKIMGAVKGYNGKVYLKCKDGGYLFGSDVPYVLQSTGKRF